MKVYDSFGTYDGTKLQFNLAGQTTNINTDIFEITAYYNVCNTSRYAIVVILQTKNGDDTDFSDYPTDCACMVNDVSFGDLDKSYLTPGDKDIFNINTGDTIHVILHHGIGFDPNTNTFDDDYIKNYKAETYTYYPGAARPGRRGHGILV